MKKSIILLFIVLVSSMCSGQKSIDKIMEKYKIESVNIMNHKFSIGDTLTFANGSLPNGDFMCAMISSEVYMKAMMVPPHLPANYINHKIIISKIYSENDGLNTSTTLVFDL